MGSESCILKLEDNSNKRRLTMKFPEKYFREPRPLCGGCGEFRPDLQPVTDKKGNRGYLCKPCFASYERLLKPDSIRNFWMCGACGFRVLAGTSIDAVVDENGGKCPDCSADVNLSLVNLSKDRPIGRGVIGEPVE
jgi:DNA-directed RNA polymerase subunit RPC12/RpoP